MTNGLSGEDCEEYDYSQLPTHVYAQVMTFLQASFRHYTRFIFMTEV